LLEIAIGRGEGGKDFGPGNLDDIGAVDKGDAPFHGKFGSPFNGQLSPGGGVREVGRTVHAYSVVSSPPSPLLPPGPRRPPSATSDNVPV
jgi:hypothetical protein